MKKVVLISILLLSLGVEAKGFMPVCTAQASPLRGGDVDPWPWGNEIRFPWTQIQGIWTTIDQDCSSFFIFAVSKPSPEGDRIVTVTQVNPNTCEVIAQGKGWTSESSKVISARMLSNGKSFSLTIRAFNSSVIRSEPTVEKDRKAGTESKTIVVSMYPHGHWKDQVSFQMTKINPTTDLICPRY